MMELCRNPVGRTPWSARVPPDPLFVWNQFPAERERPARGPAADQGVRPTIYAGVRRWEKLSDIRLKSPPHVEQPRDPARTAGWPPPVPPWQEFRRPSISDMRA